MKLTTVPVVTRWNFWFNAAKYYSSFVQFYEECLKQEESHSLAVVAVELEDGQLHHASYHYLCLNLHYINENCICLISFHKLRKSLLACIVYSMMEDVKQCLHIGASKSTFGVETDCFISELENRKRVL